MELYPLVTKPQWQDFVVRTRARREANGMPLVAAGRGIFGATVVASGGRSLPRGRRAAQHHRLSGAARVDPDRLRGGGAEGDAGERGVGVTLQEGSGAAPARGRLSAVRARPAG